MRNQLYSDCHGHQHSVFHGHSGGCDLAEILSRIILVPVIAGVSYEILQLAGRSNSKIMDLVSRPGMWMQGLTTKEPDDSMIEVGINGAEAGAARGEGRGRLVKCRMQECRMQNECGCLRQPAFWICVVPHNIQMIGIPSQPDAVHLQSGPAILHSALCILHSNLWRFFT